MFFFEKIYVTKTTAENYITSLNRQLSIFLLKLEINSFSCSLQAHWALQKAAPFSHAGPLCDRQTEFIKQPGGLDYSRKVVMRNFMERISQTKLALADSLKDLMNKIPFCKITVQNVTEHCGLNRQTFYYHFKDMYDLLEWTYKNDLVKTIKKEKRQDWEIIMRSVIRYAEKNKTFLRNTNRSLRKETLERFMYPVVSKWVSLIFSDACGDIYIKQNNKQFLLNFFTNGFIDFIIQWIGNGMQGEENELIEQVELIQQMFQHLCTVPPLRNSEWVFAQRTAK